MSNSRKARVAGIVGYPLKHSLSPVFQQAAFDFYSLPVRYQAWETPPERLGEVIAGLKDPSCVGANVTVPHKEAVMSLLDKIDDGAREIGAVNTIVNHEGRLFGLNTDADGFTRSLTEAGYTGEDKVAVVLGAGGAARAVGVSLVRAGATSITFLNRDTSRAERLVGDLAKLDGECELSFGDYHEPALQRILDACDLIVNATVVGMKHTALADKSPLPGELVRREALVFDLVYNPPITRLLLDARARGATTINGVSMLVYQGAASFELWTGKQAPVGLMFERVLEALERA
ncbi:MAG: shikimate dehydrogenase [Chloroflexi bacterium]|nr:shikimate dehydrogenase [Chloroflexota bacterium]